MDQKAKKNQLEKRLAALIGMTRNYVNLSVTTLMRFLNFIDPIDFKCFNNSKNRRMKSFNFKNESLILRSRFSQTLQSTKQSIIEVLNDL
jgi:hypothetical protein